MRTLIYRVTGYYVPHLPLSINYWSWLDSAEFVHETGAQRIWSWSKGQWILYLCKAQGEYQVIINTPYKKS